MYAITGAFRQYCFDRAVTTFGMALEAELDAVDGKTSKSINAKRSRVLDKWMERPARYRNPTMPTASAPAGDVEQSVVIGTGG